MTCISASAELIPRPSAREKEINEQKEHATAILPLPRRSRTQLLAQDQAQIESSYVDQLPFQNVLVFAQMGSPHTTRLVAMGETTFHQFTASTQ